MSSLYFQICSTAYLILLMSVYFRKKKIMTIENKIYSLLIIVTFVGLVLDYLSTYIALVDVTHNSLNLISKLYLVYLVTWLFIITIYTIVISFKSDNTKDKVKAIFKKIIMPITIISFLVCVIVLFELPLYNFSENGVVYTYGPSAKFVYSVSAISFVLMTICMLLRYKYVKRYKYLPMFSFIMLSIIGAIIQYSSPEILLVTSVAVFVTFLMYFTIENPDMKLINELNIAKSQADKANNAKSDFLSNMSHEIRTPLNAIVGFSQALKEEELPKNAESEVNDIIMASNGLLEIVNGILDFSKIEAGKLEIINKEYRFKTVWDDLISLTKSRLGDKPLDFKTNYDESIPEVLYGDSSRIKQVILNVLTNAVKYTKEGYIDFRISSFIKNDVCRLIISVEDSGIGIELEKIEQLFTKFQRLDEEKNATIEGTGLGLAITKKLLELMDGQITVQSKYGEGTKFTVILDQSVVHNPTITEDIASGEINNNVTFEGKKILVIDDNKMNLKVATRLLKSYNVITDLVESGQECIDKIKDGVHYDLLLLDDMMPQMTGIETLKKLKEIKDFNIPTIAFTANAITGVKEKYLEEGFDDYLSKPIQKTELTEILQKFFN